MKKLDTIAGNLYVATSPNGGVISDAAGTLNKEIAAGDQICVLAPSDALFCTDDAADIRSSNFKHAALVAGLAGGGVTTQLPDGFLRASFLESEGAQYLQLPNLSTKTTTATLHFANTKLNSASVWGLFGGNKTTANQWGIGCFCNYRGEILAINQGSRLSCPLTVSRLHTLQVTPSVIFIDGQETEVKFDATASDFTVGLFAVIQKKGGVNFFADGLRVFRCKADDGNTSFNLVPALAPTGQPCMYDTVNGAVYTNLGSGHFILGMTNEQASKLGRALPDGGGELIISLPAGWKEDSKVHQSLSFAAVRLWNIEVRTTTDVTSPTSTFALRRVWVRRVADPLGSHVDSDGSRWRVEWCEELFSSSDPEELGFERFRSVDAAAEYWGLVPYEYPEDELSTIEA